MGDGFDHLRCPMCGGELIYSEGTHDLCCARNPYESMSGEEWEAAAALHDERAEYGEGAVERDAGRLYIYKVWEEGEEKGLVRGALTEHGHKNAGAADVRQDGEATPLASPSRAGYTMQDDTKEDEVSHRMAEAFTGEGDGANPSDAHLKGHASSEAFGHHGGFETITSSGDDARTSDAPVKTHGGQDREDAVHSHTREVSAGVKDYAQTSDTHVKTHKCVFAVSFTESGRFGTLWSMRTVHAETNYFSLTRLMQKIEKRLRNGEPLAANAPHQPKKREKSEAAKLAFRFGIEEEDVYSIRFSTETVKRLALFYGIPERDVRRIRAAEIEED
jgi:hypothetical protein